jgi:hypothetical protein
MTASISCVIAAFPHHHPRIVPARDCEGFYVIRGDHGWLVGDRRAALAEVRELDRIQRYGR